MISDEQRREIAARLRENVGLLSRLPNEYSIEVKSALVLSKLLDCIDCFDNVFRHLADLIDRPTCRKVIPSEMEGYVFCSKCGAEIGEYGVPNYCHNCGAEVVE